MKYHRSFLLFDKHRFILCPLLKANRITVVLLGRLICHLGKRGLSGSCKIVICLLTFLLTQRRETDVINQQNYFSHLLLSSLCKTLIKNSCTLLMKKFHAILPLPFSLFERFLYNDAKWHCSSIKTNIVQKGAMLDKICCS